MGGTVATPSFMASQVAPQINDMEAKEPIMGPPV
jgi:hypothetical protein